MLIKDLPTKRKELILYKIQVCDQNLLTWKELPTAYESLALAKLRVPKTGRSRIVKRTDKGWEVQCDCWY